MKSLSRKGMLVLWLFAAAPYVLNDFSSIFVKSFPLWLAIDYGCRIASLGVLAWFWLEGGLTRYDLGFAPVRGDRVFVWTLLICTAAMYFQFFSYHPFFQISFPWPDFGDPPYDYQSPYYIWDYWFGLILVAVSEEVVARGMALTVCKRYNLGVVSTFAVSSIFFALMHWSYLSIGISHAFIMGLLLMVPTYRTGNIIPAIFAHYVANLVVY